MPNESNAEGRAYWEGRAEIWDRRAESIDEFSRPYGLAAMDALGVEPGWRVLDIGCGPGLTTLELARRVGGEGAVVGVDISSAMVAGAARRAEAAGLTNVSFTAADAQTDGLSTGFDGVYSRFGVMFFADPFAAFLNVHDALRPAGRLAFSVWAAVGDNPWMTFPTLGAAPVLGAELPAPQPDQPGPFSLAEPSRVAGLLDQAGFVDVNVATFESARIIPEATARPDVETLLEAGPVSDAYAVADAATREAAIDAVLALIEPFRDGTAWRLPGKANVVTARRP